MAEPIDDKDPNAAPICAKETVSLLVPCTVAVRFLVDSGRFWADFGSIFRLKMDFSEQVRCDH